MANRNWVQVPCPLPWGTAFASGDLLVFVGIEGNRNHLSISAKGRYPTYDEIADARYDLVGRCDMAMILPPPEDYMNIAEVFHLWEIRDPGLPIERGTAMPRTHENRS